MAKSFPRSDKGREAIIKYLKTYILAHYFKLEGVSLLDSADRYTLQPGLSVPYKELAARTAEWFFTSPDFNNKSSC